MTVCSRTIVLASRNPVKARAARGGFEKVFPETSFRLQPVSVPSGVDHQPRSDEETLAGAANRADHAERAFPAADYWVGIEGGISDRYGEMIAFAWVVVRSPEGQGKSRSGSFQLPEAVARLVRQGHELGEADDLVFERSNSKQSDGAVGILTGSVIDRTALYEHAVVLALIPFKNAELYSGD
ncbi:MAG: inosine/xanthosine triphosphatase [Thermoanaerobaculia bacterium]